jgi:hypothetical protein
MRHNHILEKKITKRYIERGMDLPSKNQLSNVLQRIQDLVVILLLSLVPFTTPETLDGVKHIKS